MSKNIQSRIQHKHDIESNWEQAINFTPKSAELIVYDMYDKDGQKVSDHIRFKIGNDVSNVNDLPFNSVGITTPLGGSILNNCSSNINLSQYGTVSGDNCYVGCKGYNFNVVGTDSIEIYVGSGFGELPANWEINDILGFKIGSKTYFALSQKITGFGGNNPVSIEVKLPISTDELSELPLSDRFVWNHNKPNNGDIHIDIDDTSNNAFSQGKEAAALGYASFSSGFRTIAAGPYDHAEGAYSIAQVGWSHAEGYNTRANGQISHSEGNATSANGAYSHSQNYRTKAIGLATHAEGYDTVARGDKSHVEGWGSIANGLVSHAEGYNTLAYADYTHAEGFKSKALGVNSHAEGGSIAGSYVKDNNGNYLDSEGNITTDESKYVVDTDAGVDSHSEGVHTEAVGNASHSEGYRTHAIGLRSHTEGCDTWARGSASHAQNYNCEANGDYSHAQGEYAVADATGAHAEGQHTRASSKYQHVQGKYNIIDSQNIYAHIVGNGRAKSYDGAGNEILDDNGNSIPVRSNAYTLDWSGNAEFAGSVKGTIANFKHVYIDGYTAATQNYVYSRITSALSNARGVNVGKEYSGSDVVSPGGEIFNDYSQNKATHNYSHAEGYNTKALAVGAHAEGYNTQAKYQAHAEGSGSRANGSASHAEGINCHADGSYSHAQNTACYALSMHSHAEGYHTCVAKNANASHVEGYYTYAHGENQHVQGQYNIDDNGTNSITSSGIGKYAHIVGNGYVQDGIVIRSNAHTLDWDGNAWFAGQITCGSSTAPHRGIIIGTEDPIENNVEGVDGDIYILYENVEEE